MSGPESPAAQPKAAAFARRLRHTAAAAAAMLLVFVAFFGCMKSDSAKGREPHPASAAAVSRLINVSSDSSAELSANAGTDAPSRGCDCGGADTCATNAIQQKAEVRAAGPEADYVGSFGAHEQRRATGVPQTRPPGARSASTTLAMHCVWRT